MVKSITKIMVLSLLLLLTACQKSNNKTHPEEDSSMSNSTDSSIIYSDESKDTLKDESTHLSPLVDGKYKVRGSKNSGWEIDGQVTIKDSKLINIKLDYLNSNGDKLSQDKEFNTYFKQEYKIKFSDLLDQLNLEYTGVNLDRIAYNPALLDLYQDYELVNYICYNQEQKPVDKQLDIDGLELNDGVYCLTIRDFIGNYDLKIELTIQDKSYQSIKLVSDIPEEKLIGLNAINAKVIKDQKLSSVKAESSVERVYLNCLSILKSQSQLNKLDELEYVLNDSLSGMIASNQ